MLLIYHNDIWAKSNYQDSRAKMTSVTFELRPKWFLKTHSLCQLKSKTISAHLPRQGGGSDICMPG